MIIEDIKNAALYFVKKVIGIAIENIMCDSGKYLEKKQVPVWIRHVIVPGVTDDEKYLYQLGHFIGRLSNLKALDALPYHTMGEKKYERPRYGIQASWSSRNGPENSTCKKQAILDGIKAARKEMEQA